MNFFLAVNGRRVKQGMFIVLISLFTAILFFSQSSLYIPVFSTKDGPKAIYKGEKGIGLTFNIGWGDVQTEPILDVLEEKGIRSATFFLSGAWAEKHPDTVKRIIDLGYEIGSLGYAYEDYTEMEDEQVRRDMLKSVEILKKLEVKEVTLLRSPTGHFDERTLKVADQLGLTVVHWSVNSQDWKNPGTKEIIENIKKAKKGDIILMHASDAATQTAEALPEILAILKSKDELINLSVLITNGNVKTRLVP